MSASLPILVNYKNMKIIENINLEAILDFEVDLNTGGWVDPLGQTITWLTGYLNDLWNWAIQGLQGIVQTIVSLAVESIGNAINIATRTINDIYATIIGIPGKINQIFVAIQSLINSFPSLNQIISALPSLSQITSEVSGLLANVQDSINKIPLLNTIITSLPSISQITSGVSGLLSVVTTAINKLPSLAQISSTVTGALSGIGTAITNLPSDIVTALTNSFNQISSAIQSLGATIIGQITPILNQFGLGLSAIGAQIIAGISTALKSFTDSFDQLVHRINLTLSDYLTQIGSGITTIGNQIIAGINKALASLNVTLKPAFDAFTASLTTQFNRIQDFFNGLKLPDLATDIISKILDFFKSIKLSTLASEVLKRLEEFFGGLKLPDFAKIVQDIGNFLIAFGRDPIGTFRKIVDDALKFFGLPTIDEMIKGIDDLLKRYLPDFGNVFDFIAAFGKDPIGTMRKIVDDALKFFGLPTTGDIVKGITDWFNKTPLKYAVEFPENFMKFINFTSLVIDKLTEEHSPSILDDIWNALKWFFGKVEQAEYTSARSGLFGALPQLMTLFTDVKWKPDGSVDTMQLAWPKLDVSGGVVDYFKNLAGAIIPTLKEGWAELSKMFSDLANWLVDTIIATTKLPAPATGITDPFAKLISSFTQAFSNLATKVKTSTPVTIELFTTIVEGAALGTGFSEGLEYAGLALDATHPVKEWKFREKFKDFIDKIGLGHVTGIVGATLAAVSLAPPMRRFWNKLSQVQLPSENALIEMWHRDLFDEKLLDEYLSEHGLDPRFRNGLKENYLKIPSYDQIIDAYLRFMIEGKITKAKMESELTAYLKVFDLKDIARKGMSFSEKDLVGKMIYRFLSRFERRALNAVGLLEEKTATDILTADRIRPDLIPLLTKAERLQGSLTYRNQIQSKIAERVRKGFVVISEYTDVLTKAEYAKSAIDYLVQANQIDIQTTIDEARLKEVDQNYAQAIIEKPEYVKTVGDIIKNPEIAKEHIAIVDITRRREDEGRVRAEGNLAVSYSLAAFAEGAITESEFDDLAAAMGKQPDEIDRLESARSILLKNKIRTVRFRTLQTKLAKRQINPAQFIAQATALPIDNALAVATSERIVSQITKVSASFPK